jgi:capsular polysaccharide transport system permease protein
MLPILRNDLRLTRFMLKILQNANAPQALTNDAGGNQPFRCGKIPKMQELTADQGVSRPGPTVQVTKQRRFRTLRVVFALILRETGSRDTRNSLGFLWNLIDPIATIGILSIAFSIISRNARLGTSFQLYYVTGVVPFHLYTAIASRVAGSVRFSRPLLGFPSVTILDALLARFLLISFTNILVFVILLVGVNEYYDLRIHPDVGSIILALTMAMAFGLGVGTLNAVLFVASPTYESIFSIVTRPLMLASGVLFLIGDLPDKVFNLLKWNPCAHFVGELRHAFYPEYDTSFVSPGYVFLVSGICFTLGLIGLRRYVVDAMEY